MVRHPKSNRALEMAVAAALGVIAFTLIVAALTLATKKVTAEDQPLPEIPQWEIDAWANVKCANCGKPLDPRRPGDGYYPGDLMLCGPCGKEWMEAMRKAGYKPQWERKP